MKSFLLTWTPRAIAVGVGGYYGLGLAYSSGLMAAIDKLAIPIIQHQLGYIGLGAIMPTFQWYAAWSARITFGALFALLYNIIERIILAIAERLGWGMGERASPPPSLHALGPQRS